MKITIGHLFYDLLTLYGESGNVKALAYQLKKQGIDVEIKNISIDNKLDLDNLDVLYLGAGSEENQLIALDYLKNYTEDLKQALSNGLFILATGNSIELFGKFIQNENDGSKIDALSIFDYFTLRTKKRIVYECLFKCDIAENNVLGFENQQGYLKGNKYPLFTVTKGFGDVEKGGIEGFHKDNFYGTYLLGPILARNPKLLKLLCTKIIQKQMPDFIFNDFDFDFDEKAYENYIEKYSKD